MGIYLHLIEYSDKKPPPSQADKEILSFVKELSSQGISMETQYTLPLTLLSQPELQYWQAQGDRL